MSVGWSRDGEEEEWRPKAPTFLPLGRMGPRQQAELAPAFPASEVPRPPSLAHQR